MKDTRSSAAQSPFAIPAPTQTEIEIVRHFARLAAERDYKEMLATGRIPHLPPASGTLE
jgi:hypothetical protein